MQALRTVEIPQKEILSQTIINFDAFEDLIMNLINFVFGKYIAQKTAATINVK